MGSATGFVEYVVRNNSGEPIYNCFVAVRIGTLEVRIGAVTHRDAWTGAVET
jgi:hypothetical protein